MYDSNSTPMESHHSNSASFEQVRYRAVYRLIARYLDRYVLGYPVFMVAVALIMFVLPADSRILNELYDNGFAIALFLSLALMPIEAAMIAGLGTTPGKWLFGIRVRDQAGGKLSFFAAFKRTSIVFILGDALMMPMVCLLTWVFGYASLTRSGITLWDRSAGAQVIHLKWTKLRVLILLMVSIIPVCMIFFFAQA